MDLPVFLTRDPDGDIRLTGYRIGLYTVIRHLQNGHAPQGVSQELPVLPPELICQIEEFYRNHQTEVDAYVEAYRADLERQAADLRKEPSTEELKRRWVAKGLGALP